MANPFSDEGVSDADFEEAMNSDEVFEGKIELAEKVVAYAKRISPVLTGEYRDHWHVETYGRRVYVVNDDDKAGYIEYGTEDTPEFAIRAQVQAKFRLAK